MAQGIRPPGKVRKIFYTIMNTPTSLRQQGDNKKPTSKKEKQTWAVDSAPPR